MDRLECYERRDVELSDCKESNPDDCHRVFHIYLPNIICGHGVYISGSDRTGDMGSSDDDELPNSIEIAGTLPLVFGIHCYGCTVASITNFVPHANSRNVALVLPEGLHNSFNARHCCGYALENEIHDVEFFKQIQSMLSDEYTFLQPGVSYAVGWSNGGFMVMHAASLFRSISPISGNIYDIDPGLKKGGTFCVDGICVDAPGTGKSLFLHHGMNDGNVRPTGCCDNPDMPKCCCGIAADTCVSIMEVAQNWALEVNGCEVAQRKLLQVDESDGGGEAEEGGKEGQGSVKEEGTDEVMSVPGTNFTISYKDPDRGIECLTTTGTKCKANTTICLHEESGHFNRPSFEEAFPFAEEVIEFFAKDACEINNGKWNGTSGVCVCPEKQGGTYCLDDPIILESVVSPEQDEDDVFTVDPVGKSSKRSQRVSIAYLLFALAMFTLVRQRCKKGKKKDGLHFNDSIEEMEESTELVPSQGLHTS